MVEVRELNTLLQIHLQVYLELVHNKEQKLGKPGRVNYLQEILILHMMYFLAHQERILPEKEDQKVQTHGDSVTIPLHSGDTKCSIILNQKR